MKLDDFESVFRSAVKEPFHYQPPKLETALLITDLAPEQSQQALESVTTFLKRSHTSDIEWSVLSRDDFSEVSQILDRVRRNPPSIVVCYRHILGQGAKLPYSLGSTVDTLTQATDVPVLLLPRPKDGVLALPKQTDRVMVVTDHLTGDDALTNWAAHLCTDDGTLFLTHIEDEGVFRKYVDAMSKIPGIDQEMTAKIKDKLMSMPTDYIRSTTEALAAQGIHENVVSIVGFGDPTKEYQEILGANEVRLLVMNTKDEGQLAMHSLAYALAVEIRDCPLLLL